MERRAIRHPASATTILSARNGSKEHQDEHCGCNCVSRQIQRLAARRIPTRKKNMQRTELQHLFQVRALQNRVLSGKPLGTRLRRMQKCIHCTNCVTSGCDEDREIYQLYEQSTLAIPKTPEFGDIKELSDPKPDDEQPRNQCSWCELGLASQGTPPARKGHGARDP